MVQQPGIQNQETVNPFSARIMRRIVPVFVIILAMYVIVGLIFNVQTSVSRLQDVYNTTLNQTNFSLQQALEPHVRATRELATDGSLRAYLALTSADINAALARAREIMQRDSDLYETFRVIGLNSRVRLQLSNQGGVIVITNPGDLATIQEDEGIQLFESEAFRAIVQGNAEQVVIGSLHELKDSAGRSYNPPRASLALYTGVYSGSGLLAGVIRLEINALPLLDVINRAGQNLIEPLSGRSLVLVDAAGKIMADSVTPAQSYLTALDAAEGNARGNPLHETLADLARRDAHSSSEIISGNVVSTRTINFNGAEPSDWHLFFVDNLATAYGSTTAAAVALVLLTLAGGFLAVYMLRRLIDPVLVPVVEADLRVRQLAQGQRATSGGVSGNELVTAVDNIAHRVETLSQELDTQRQRRTRDVQIAGRIGRETAVLGDVDTIVPRAINLICNELGFYHAQVFLVDDTGTTAVLQYSRGDAGKKMLERGHRIRIASPTVVGTVTGDKRPVVVNDTVQATEAGKHGFNPLLPETRAEMGLPLVIGDEIIGVLDIQSREVNAFNPEDIPTFQLLADQLAIAIYNARLKTQSERRIQQINRLNQQLTRTAWDSTEEKTDLTDVYGVPPGAESANALSVPISIRGEVIGTLDAGLPEGEFTAGDNMIMQAVAERVALAMENARLFQETQSSLAETSSLYQLSQQLNEAATLEEVINAIIITVAPDASGGQVWLFEDYLTGELPGRVTLLVDVPTAPRSSTTSLTGIVLQMQEHEFLKALTAEAPHFVPDVKNEPLIDHVLQRILNLLEAQGMVFIPLNMRGAWKGFISLEFNKPRRFADREQRVYTALIGQAGVAIDNRLLLRQTEEALSRNEKLYAASRIINTSETLEDLVYAAVATSSDPELNFWLALLEGDADETGWATRARVIAQSSQGGVEAVERVHKVYIPADSPMRRREPMVIRDPGDDAVMLKESVQWMRSMGQRFVAAFPLFSDNTPIALFYIVSEKPVELSADDFEVYRALTGQMSTQIQNRRLLQRTEQALSETRRLYVASSAIATAADTTAVYEALPSHLALPFMRRDGQDVKMSITLLIAHPEPVATAPLLEYAYQWSSETGADAPAVGTMIPHNEAPFGRLTSESMEGILRYRNLTAEAETDEMKRIHAILAEGDAASAMVAPLRSRQSWLGVIICRSSLPNFFDDSYARFMQAFGGQVAIAMERQQLLIQTEMERANLTSILATLPAGVLVLDPHSFLPIQINERVKELLGQDIDYSTPFTSSQYNLYRTGTNLFYPDEELPIYTARRLDRPMFSDDVAVINGDLQTDLLVNAAPIYDTRGQVIALVAAFQDISNLRSLENTLQENLRETVSLYETQRSLSQAETLEELLDNILMQLAMQQPEDAHVVLTHISDGAPYVARSLVMPLEPVEAIIPLLTADVVKIDDTATSEMLDEAARAALDITGVRSILVMPLTAKTRERPIGWLVITSAEADAFSPDQERMLTTLGDMATTAIDNNYLVQSTQAALQETAALYSAASTISRARDLSELADALEGSLATLQPDVYAGFLYLTQQNTELNELFNFGFNEEEILSLSFRNLVTLDLPPEDQVYIARRGAEGEFETELAKSGSIVSMAAINLRVKDLPGGRLFVGYRDHHRFSDGEVRFLNTLSDSASIVLDNQLLLEQIQSTLQETSVLYQASRALIEISEPNEIIDVIVNYLIEPHINQVFIVLLSTATWDNPGASVSVVSSWQSDSDVDLLGVTLTPDQFPAWRQLSSEVVLTINDIYDPGLGLDPLEQTSIESLDTRSLVIIPLRVSTRAIGAIWLGSRQPFTYTDQNLRIFQAFAEQTSLSLEAARLLAQTERRARQLETSAVISQSIGQILDLDVLLPQVVDLIRDQFGYDHVQVFLIDENNEYAVLRASTGDAGRQLLAIKHKLRRGSESVIGSVTATGKSSLALDTADAAVVHMPNPYLPLTRSEMALPLAIKGEVVGALDVQSNQPNAFNEEDIQVLTTLAAQIAVAIDNARLYVESISRATEMSFLFDVTTAAAAAETLEESLGTIAQRLAATLNSLSVVIYVPTVFEDFEKNQVVWLKPTALAGVDQPLSELTTVRVGDGENLVGSVASTLQSVIVNDVSREMRYFPAVPTARSAIVVPINSGQELIGLLAMENSHLNAYDSDTLTLLLTLAGSLAATIQNRQLVGSLQKSNEQLREVDRLKSQFLASMSHELRTPLNSIIGFSRVMLKGIDGPLTEMQEQDLSTIYNSGNHLLNLINDILDQAKIEANELNLKYGYFDVKPMVESVKSIAVGLIKEKPLRLMVEVAPNLPQAYGDEFRSRQILLNLVSNAVKFTTEGSVTVRAYGETRRGKTFIRVDVIDTGIGIGEADIGKLFQRFRQVDSSLTRTVGGTGLGLAISKSLAELQGGEITVASEINVGSTFTVTVPIEPGAENVVPQKDSSEPVKPPSSKAPDTSPRIKKKPATGELRAPVPAAAPAPRPTMTRELPALPAKRDVLLIEDNKEMVDQYRRTLQREGFEVQTADHPAYARAMVGQLRPSLVIMDVGFGGGQGWDILKDLKEQDETFDIPVIVCTLAPDSERAYRLGAHTFLQRPVLPNKLLEEVLKAEKESRRERILIIDDIPENIRVLKQMLDEHGDYRVFSAETGKEGISMVARRRPNLVILDLRMPDMDGFAVLDELRNNPETARIPVMIVTSDVSLTADEQALLEGIRVLPRTDISQEEFERFINDVKAQLNNGGHAGS